MIVWEMFGIMAMFNIGLAANKLEDHWLGSPCLATPSNTNMGVFVQSLLHCHNWELIVEKMHIMCVFGLGIMCEKVGSILWGNVGTRTWSLNRALGAVVDRCWPLLAGRYGMVWVT